MSRRHTVRPGECIDSIAHRYGLWAQTLWDHPDNAALREQRKSRNVLFPGDVVVVPDVREELHEAVTGKRHRFRRRGVPSKLDVRIHEDGKAIADAPYRYELGGEVVHEGRTDGDGHVREWIPPAAESARIVLKPDTEGERVIPLRVGHLDPVTSESGIRGRLFNLGYLDRVDDDEDQVLLALCYFQEDEGLGVNGVADGETAAKLVERHGS